MPSVGPSLRTSEVGRCQLHSEGLTIEQAAKGLNVSDMQVGALLKMGEFRGIQVGGRGYLARLCRCGLFPEIRGRKNPMHRRICEVREDRWA